MGYLKLKPHPFGPPLHIPFNEMTPKFPNPILHEFLMNSPIGPFEGKRTRTGPTHPGVFLSPFGLPAAILGCGAF